MTQEPVPDQSRTLVVRVWMPDRPGALGQVASRIGALHGDVTAIDILEHGGGKVIDELVVTLPSSASIDLLAKEIGAVDGVAVEHIRTVRGGRPDSATAVLELTAEVAETPADRRLGVLCAGLMVALDADWAVAVRDGALVECHGEAPELGWLLAFVEGSGHLDPSAPAATVPGDVVWAPLAGRAITVAAGRAARSIHERERVRVGLLARAVGGLIP